MGLEHRGWRGWLRSHGQGSGWLPLCQGREELSQGCHRHLPPLRVEKVVLVRSHDATVKGFPRGMRTGGIGKKWWELQ